MNEWRVVRLVQGLAGAFSLLTFVLVLAVTYLLVRPLFFMPLGNYPTQEVIEPRGADGLPTVSLAGGVVHTRSVKCNLWHVPIRVSGSNLWQKREGERLTVINGTAGSSERKVGCETIEYTNRIPPNVTEGVWQIRGTETALGNDWLGQLTQAKTWETEKFRIEP